MILIFYYLTLQQNHALVTSFCMQLHFSEERGKYHCDVSALPVTNKERGWKRQSASALGWKTDTNIVACFVLIHSPVFVFAIKTHNNICVCFSFEGWYAFAFLTSSLFSHVALVFTSLPTKMQLHIKWRHKSMVLLQRLVIRKQNHTTVILPSLSNFGSDPYFLKNGTYPYWVFS